MKAETLSFVTPGLESEEAAYRMLIHVLQNVDTRTNIKSEQSVRISTNSGFVLFGGLHTRTQGIDQALGITMAENSTAANSSMDVRLLINKKSRRVLYAEAGKDFVDLLFGFLLLPTGTVIRLLREHGTTSSKSVGSISNLYKSVDKLNATYMTTDKSLFLKPHESIICYNGSPLIQYATPPIYYACRNAHIQFHSKHELSTRKGQRCRCGQELTIQLHFLDHPSSSSANSDQVTPGCVKETVTFIITDDLNILPISTITSIILLNQLLVKDLSELEERTVTVGPQKALELLWASMTSTTVLNDVFSPSSSTASAPPEMDFYEKEGPTGSRKDME